MTYDEAVLRGRSAEVLLASIEYKECIDTLRSQLHATIEGSAANQGELRDACYFQLTGLAAIHAEFQGWVQTKDYMESNVAAEVEGPEF